MTKTEINPTIARLDRSAARLGIDLKRYGTNGRSFWYKDREIRFMPRGKGTVRIESYFQPVADGDMGPNLDPDSIAYGTAKRVEQLFINAKETGR